jgi:SAM-dependent methyltransferase
MREDNVSLFDRKTLSSAKRLILTSLQGKSSSERWQHETDQVVLALDPYLSQADLVVDFGIGVGRVSKEILEKYPNLKIIGVDASKRMLDLCYQYVPQRYFTDGRIKLLELSQIDTIASSTVDLILAIYVIQHISSALLEPSLNQLQRILKPEGYLYVLNHYRRNAVQTNKDEAGLFQRLRALSFNFPSIPKTLEYIYSSSRLQRRIVNRELKRLYDDGINVEELLERKFRLVSDLEFDDPYMQKVLRFHFSKIYQRQNKPN